MNQTIDDLLREHDAQPLPAERLAEFKALCAYQCDRQPGHALEPAFRRIMSADTLTYGEAALICPFMVYP